MVESLKGSRIVALHCLRIQNSTRVERKRLLLEVKHWATRIWNYRRPKLTISEQKGTLTFVVVLLRPICCDEATQSSSTDVLTAWPFADFEESWVVAKWLWRKVLGDYIRRKGGIEKWLTFSGSTHLFWWLWSNRFALYRLSRRGKAYTKAECC